MADDYEINAPDDLGYDTPVDPAIINSGILNTPGSTTSFGEDITKLGKSAVDMIQKTGITNLPSQVLGRLGGGILPGGLAMVGKQGVPAPAPSVGEKDDWKVKISLPAGATTLYRDGSNAILSPLVPTNGVVFPVTPSVTGIQHTAHWEAVKLVHSNYPALFYSGSEVNEINISGEFPVQSLKDANYYLAAVIFFRAATKMFFGQSDQNTGAPPQIFLLNGFGPKMFNNVPVVLKTVQFDLPQDVDYIAAQDGTRIPTLSKITVVCQPIYSRAQIAKFNYKDYAAGRTTGFL